MMQVLLVDDEPLVLIGLQSMIDWTQMGLEICATARNGQRALELIEKLRPDIVITDIRMPLCSGLELGKQVRAMGMELPVFIMLTSYEEFEYARDALHLGAVEYLVKLELTPDSLRGALCRALERVQEIQRTLHAQAPEHSMLLAYREKFFARLYHSLFESRTQFQQQQMELGLEFPGGHYTVVHCAEDCADLPPQAAPPLSPDVLQMVYETVNKYQPAYVTGLDMRHFNILLCAGAPLEPSQLRLILETTLDTVRQILNIRLCCGVSAGFTDLFLTGGAFQQARTALEQTSSHSPLAFAKSCTLPADSLHTAAFRPQLTRAFEELDSAALHETFTQIIRQIETDHCTRVSAIGTASILLHMAISLLPEGETTVNAIFSDQPDGCCSLYRQPSPESCQRWIEQLRDGLCRVLCTRRQNYKERIMANVQEYIHANIGKKLTLSKVASFFNFSPSYLSQLFARYSDTSFVEYVTNTRIAMAKTMLAQADKKIYEISDLLGFESAFYFSTVFKKVTGQSPREYVKSLQGPQPRNGGDT